MHAGERHAGCALWAWADIRRRHWSLLALAVLVALPVGFSLALVAGALRAGSSVDRYVESTALADVVAFIDGEPAQTSSIVSPPILASPRSTARTRS